MPGYEGYIEQVFDILEEDVGFYQEVEPLEQDVIERGIIVCSAENTLSTLHM